jgi:hypothetical protein
MFVTRGLERRAMIDIVPSDQRPTVQFSIQETSLLVKRKSDNVEQQIKFVFLISPVKTN